MLFSILGAMSGHIRKLKFFKGDKWSSNKFMERKPYCKADALLEHIHDLLDCGRPCTISNLNNSILWVKVIRFKKVIDSNIIGFKLKLKWST